MTARTFIRSRVASHGTSVEVAKSLRAALDADETVEIHDEIGEATAPAFTLHAHGHGVIARAPGGRHLGTFADALIGIQDAFTVLDRAAPEQPASRIRSRRPTREKATGERR